MSELIGLNAHPKIRAYRNYAQLQEKGLPLSPIISPNPHTKFFFLDSPEGVRIQLIMENNIAKWK